LGVFCGQPLFFCGWVFFFFACHSRILGVDFCEPAEVGDWAGAQRPLQVSAGCASGMVVWSRQQLKALSRKRQLLEQPLPACGRRSTPPPKEGRRFCGVFWFLFLFGFCFVFLLCFVLFFFLIWGCLLLFLFCVCVLLFFLFFFFFVFLCFVVCGVWFCFFFFFFFVAFFFVCFFVCFFAGCPPLGLLEEPKKGCLPFAFCFFVTCLFLLCGFFLFCFSAPQVLICAFLGCLVFDLLLLACPFFFYAFLLQRRETGSRLPLLPGSTEGSPARRAREPLLFRTARFRVGGCYHG
jgi:hypothetical protein